MPERRQRLQHRVVRDNLSTLNPWKNPLFSQDSKIPQNVEIDCGWGRLLFGHTFESNQELADCLRREAVSRRDIAIYIGDPHVVLALAPQELFLDPSHTYRLHFENYRAQQAGAPSYRVRKLQSIFDAEGVNRIYSQRQMVEVDPRFIVDERRGGCLTYLVAEDVQTGRIIGTVTGVDHVDAFNDPERGCSLWALAVDPQTTHPGVGHALVVHLLEHYLARGRAYIDLSVMHDNRQAISLYEKLGFSRVPVFCVKTRNSINEPLFVGQESDAQLNPYAQIITRAARRRGISVELVDAEQGYFNLHFGGRSIGCRESLTELTSAIAMSRCDDKRVTRRVLTRVGITMPEQIVAGTPEENGAFLERHGSVVVKPVRGEQGRGVCVGIDTAEALQRAVEKARDIAEEVLIEQLVLGHDLRIVVIDFRVVAAAIRRPPEVVGSGDLTVLELIQKQSRRRRAATGGESAIPLDSETERCVAEAGYRLTDTLPAGKVIVVRKAANLHTGGTIHDVTDSLHPKLVEVAKRSAEVLDLPVVGLDLIVPSVHKPEYWVIEANERPGLANHEPQPTAERFIDLLFPQTVTQT